MILAMNFQHSTAQGSHLNPTEFRFLERLKKDWASLAAMKKLVKGGCEPSVIYYLLCAYWFGQQKALDEHRAATRKLKASFEGLHKHLSAACEEIAEMRKLPEYPELHGLFVPIEELRDVLENLIPELGKAADKRGAYVRRCGSLRRFFTWSSISSSHAFHR